MIVRPAEPRSPGSESGDGVVPRRSTSRPCRPTSRRCSAKRARSAAIPTSRSRCCATGSRTVPQVATCSTPDEVVRRSHPRTMTEATAAAEFELGQHLHRSGRSRGGDSALARRRTGSTPTTGPTSARPGTSRIRCARVTPTCTRVRGSKTSRRSAPRTTTRRSSRSAPHRTHVDVRDPPHWGDAGPHGGSAPRGRRDVDDVEAQLRDAGCVIVEGLAPPGLLDRIAEELEPYLAATQPGADDFAGRNTRRTGALLARSPAFAISRRTRSCSARSTACSAITRRATSCTSRR